MSSYLTTATLTPVPLCRLHFLQVGVAAQRSALGTRPPDWLTALRLRQSKNLIVL
ncbi:hypothetical protein [Nostoc sp. MG11]|uniref:hypothetical protein n=1 Tax=Nostoc sp. MG11 TaxID=2721166 RepID=UPI001865B33D|nr:hypothetical protein [Nostoc sp. MG11]